MSSFVLLLPKLILSVERLSSSDIPIAFKTGEGFVIPEPQADPFDNSIPLRSSLASRISLRLPGKEILISPGTLLLGSPLYTIDKFNSFIFS